jgi:non-ribosomal peptide synthase protein (TIGR01720 family)
VTAALDAEETRALLHEVPGQSGARPEEILLAALGRGLSAWSGGPVRVDVEGHGRGEDDPEVDLTRTVGWFTAITPVLLGPPPGAADLPALRRELAAAAARGDRAAEPPSEVAFNYLGQLGPTLVATAPLRLGAEGTGPLQSPRRSRAYPLAVNAWVADGRLTVSLGYGARRWSRATVEALAVSIAVALRELIERCRHADAAMFEPGPATFAGLDPEDLEVALEGVEFGSP